jgi:Hemerythrin HHE cation binding domain
MGRDLPDLIRDQHAELRELLAELCRQPEVTERILGPQIRARERLLQQIRRVYLAQQAARLRYLWPRLRAASPEGRSYTDRAWAQTRAVEARMAKREWFGERDEVRNELDHTISWGIQKQLVLEERELGRIADASSRGELDGPTLVRRLSSRGPWPTRPHPDVPASPRLASIAKRPLALSDRLLDRLAHDTE